MKYLSIIVICFGLESCKSLDAQLKCFAEQQKDIRNTLVYKSVQKAAIDTILAWINQGINGHGINGLRTDKDWQIDSSLFFNTAKSRCVLLVLSRDTSKDSKLDNVTLFYGAEINKVWHFYWRSMPTLYSYHHKDSSSNSFAELSLLARKTIIKSGYYKKGTCTINDSYVNDWYTEELVRQHQLFLEEK